MFSYNIPRGSSQYLLLKRFLSYLCLLDFVGGGAPSSSNVANVFLLFNRDTRFLATLTRAINSSFDMSWKKRRKWISFILSSLFSIRSRKPECGRKNENFALFTLPPKCWKIIRFNYISKQCQIIKFVICKVFNKQSNYRIVLISWH